MPLPTLDPDRLSAAAAPSAAAGRSSPAAVVILAGVAAALHVGKLPPAIPALREALGISLVQAGFMLSLVQFAGMALGLAIGLLADRIGLRRTMLAGLTILAAASAVGGAATSPAMLLALRAVEGLGFLLTVTPAPSLIRRLVGARPERALGVWGAYMPIGTASALLVAPLVLGAIGWRGWWWAMAVVTLAVALAVRTRVPPDRDPAETDGRRGPMPSGPATDLFGLARRTLASPGPWALALAFAAYSGQWIAVLGFLPSIYAQAGVAPAAAGVATALVAAANMVGNIAAGRLLQRGWPAPRLLHLGFATMAAGAAVAYLPWTEGLPILRYVGLVLFSMLGGLVPGTLFALAVRLAPDPRTVSSTVGWMQQCSACGQFAGPPLVAWVAARVGGWQWTWAVTGAMAVGGMAVGVVLSRLIDDATARTR